MTVDKQPQDVIQSAPPAPVGRVRPVSSSNLEGLTEEEVAEFAGCEVVTTFGSRLQRLMDEQKRTKQDLATAASVSRQAVTNWIVGTAPDILFREPERAARLAKFLNVSTDWLLYGRAEDATKSPAHESGTKEDLIAVLRDVRPIARRLDDLVRKLEDLTED